MRIGIFGDHTDLHPGFSGAMSLNQLAAFSGHGHELVLYIPVLDEELFARRLSALGCRSSDDLDRFGLDFEIKPLTKGSRIDADLDVLIWQSYRKDDEAFWPKRRGYLITKNVPRFVANSSERYARKARNQLAKFDRLAFSLETDFRIVEKLCESEAGRFGYVPRGFSPDWLPNTRKGARPFFACDAAVKAADGGEKATSHMVALFEELRRRGLQFDIAATRGAAALVGADTKIDALPMLRFYDEFISPAWIYLPCNLDYSVHCKNLDTSDEGQPVYVGLFENQMVEIQMSGGVPLYQRGHMDSEIVFDEGVCSVEDYRDTTALADACEAIIGQFAEVGARARSFATEAYSHDVMRESWVALLEGHPLPGRPGRSG